MKTLTLTMQNADFINPIVKANGTRLRFKKNAQGILESKFETDSDQVFLQISRYYEMSQKYWYLYAIFFWIIGIFGLFSPRYEKTCPTLNFESTFSLEDLLEVHLKFNNFYEGYAAFDLVSPQANAINNATNRYYYNQTAQRNAKKYRWASRILLFPCIAATVFLIVHFIVNPIV